MPSPVHPYSDYGVALRTLKSARSWLAFMLIVCVLTQFIGFALIWWTPQPFVGMRPPWSPQPKSAQVDDMREWMRTHQSTTAPGAASKPAPPPDSFFPVTDESRHLGIRKEWDNVYTLAVPVTQLAGLIAISSQCIIVFVTLLVLLVAQAPGVAQITRSFIWSVLVLFMFFPWQYLARDFPIPGVIYSYLEMLRRFQDFVDHTGDKLYPFYAGMIYGRFIVWPLLGLLALLVTAERFRAGVTIAIGHPLQSMFQPRSAGVSPLPPLLATQPRPMPSPKVTGTR